MNYRQRETTQIERKRERECVKRKYRQRDKYRIIASHVRSTSMQWKSDTDAQRLCQKTGLISRVRM